MMENATRTHAMIFSLRVECSIGHHPAQKANRCGMPRPSGSFLLLELILELLYRNREHVTCVAVILLQFLSEQRAVDFA
jgi:hypothetical protein